MRIEVIYCPACNHKLRVPENLMGMPVECPQCHATFVAPPASPEAPLVRMPQRTPDEAFQGSAPLTTGLPERPDLGDGETDDLDDQGYGDIRRGPLPPGHVKILAPAVGLVAVAVIILCLNALDLVMFLAMPQMFNQQMQMLTGQAPDGSFMAFAIGMRVVSIILALLQMTGGFCMMRSRGYALAVIASLLSLVNPNCCCPAGIAVGIWSLVVLFQSEVKDSFQR